MEKHRGKLIVLEGGEGVGKSTNLEWIRHQLELRGIPVKTTREPGGTAFAEKLRSLLLDARSMTEIFPETELLLMFAARKQHIQEVIRPCLESGVWVVCDRFTDASYAYQGGGRGLPMTHIEYLEHWIQDGIYPDRVLLFDAPVELGLQRVGKRGDKDRFEQEQKDFFQRVRDIYLQRAKQNPSRYRIIDASLNLTQVQQQLEQILRELLTQETDVI